MAAAEGQLDGNGISHDGPDDMDIAADASLLQNPVIARLGTCLQVINQAHRGGEGLGPVPMRPTLLKMLRPLLRVQASLLAPGFSCPSAILRIRKTHSEMFVPIPLKRFSGGVVICKTNFRPACKP